MAIPMSTLDVRKLDSRILVIDDESMILDTVKMILEDLGCVVDTASDPLDGIERAIAGCYDLVITDIRMPVRDGSEVIEAVLAVKPRTRMLVMTAWPDDPRAARALKSGAIGLLKKPFEVSSVLSFLARDQGSVTTD